MNTRGDTAISSDNVPTDASSNFPEPESCGVPTDSSVDTQSCADAKVQLAVYDFDGTCITGNSPVLLVRYLRKRKMLSWSQVAGIVNWAIRYKLRLPQDESSVRSKVFRPFAGRIAEDVDAFLRDFYDEVVAARWRPQADQTMRQHQQEGCFVMVVSATWQAIADRACETHPFECAVATRMVVDGAGKYTREVEGLPVEGAEKLRVVQRFADERFGAGKWELAYAYGDHHSDRELLSAAKQPFAVSPDNPLERTAKANGWPILEW